MVFSRFTKKDEPTKSVKKDEPSRTVKTAKPAPLPSPVKVTVEKIDQIEAEMMELDFTKSIAAPPPLSLIHI